MNGIHDIGGMHGFGPILREDDEPLFHHEWEARVLAVALATPSLSNIDAGRHQMELIPPSEYLRMSYYERWLHILRDLLVRIGTVTAEEVATGRPAADAAKQDPLLRPEAVGAALMSAGSYARPKTTPGRFVPGDAIRARNINPTGHTRLPRYVRGRCGTIAECHGAFVYPDSHARGNGEDPQPLYTVKFHAQELWGEEMSAVDTIYLDLWEPYLELR